MALVSAPITGGSGLAIPGTLAHVSAPLAFHSDDNDCDGAGQDLGNCAEQCCVVRVRGIRVLSRYENLRARARRRTVRPEDVVVHCFHTAVGVTNAGAALVGMLSESPRCRDE